MRSSQIDSEELEAMLEEHPAEVTRMLDDIHPEDFADVVDNLGDERAGELLMQLPPDFAAQVFERLDDERQGALAESLGVESTAKLALNMDADDLADFISIVPPSMSQSLLDELTSADPEVAKDVAELRRWPETSAGGLMTTDYIEISPYFTINQAIETVRRSAVDAETIDSLCVTDKKRVLLGILTTRRMLLANPTDRVEDVMLRGLKTVPPELDQEDVARKLAKYDLLAMPVVDENGRLLGMITADDVLDVLTDEQSEDVHKMGAMDPLRDGYFATSFAVFLQKRIPWLLVLFFGGFLATQTLQTFHHELQLVTQLAFYLPLLISAGGNSGAQSSTLIIRGLALGDVKVADWVRVLTREFLLGLTIGGTLALFGVGRALIAGDGADFALLVGTTVITIVVLGCVVGAMTPLLLHRVKIDPATSSTPFIATLVDVFGILVYLALARLLLSALQTAAPS